MLWGTGHFLGPVQREMQKCGGVTGALIGEIVVHAKFACKVAETLNHRSYACCLRARLVWRLLRPEKGIAINDEMHIRGIEERGFKYP